MLGTEHKTQGKADNLKCPPERLSPQKIETDDLLMDQVWAPFCSLTNCYASECRHQEHDCMLRQPVRCACSMVLYDEPDYYAVRLVIWRVTKFSG